MFDEKVGHVENNSITIIIKRRTKHHSLQSKKQLTLVVSITVWELW